MARVFYTKREKFSIYARTAKAREMGFKWKEAHKIAQEAGFRGGVGALQVFMRGGKKRRPKGSGKPKAPASGLSQLVEAEVQRRVRVLLEGVIAKLKAAL